LLDALIGASDADAQLERHLGGGAGETGFPRALERGPEHRRGELVEGRLLVDGPEDIEWARSGPGASWITREAGHEQVFPARGER
jgi:hypothetical protein